MAEAYRELLDTFGRGWERGAVDEIASVFAPDAVVQAGLEYVRIPMGHGMVSDATFGRLLDAVRELAGKRSVFVHCNSGNRVGAGLIPYFMLEQGLEEQEAVAQAMRVGLRSAELMEQALEYVRSRQGI